MGIDGTKLATALGTAAVLATVTACSSSGSGHAAGSTSPTTQSPPASTSTSATSAASATPTVYASGVSALPAGAIPSALVGTYTYEFYAETFHATLRADGTYAQWNGDDELDIVGKYGVRGNVAVFVDGSTGATTGQACDGPGDYTWKFAGKVLMMTIKDDHCTVGRLQQWTLPWTKVSSTSLPTAPTLAQAEHG